jgi:hypothetical protein
MARIAIHCKKRQDAEHQANLKRKVMHGRRRMAKSVGSPLQRLTARSPTPACAHLVTAGFDVVGAPPPEAATRRRPRPQLAAARCHNRRSPRPPETTGRHCIVLCPHTDHTGQRAPIPRGPPDPAEAARIQGLPPRGRAPPPTRSAGTRAAAPAEYPWRGRRAAPLPLSGPHGFLETPSGDDATGKGGWRRCGYSIPMGRARLMARGTTLKSTTLARP